MHITRRQFVASAAFAAAGSLLQPARGQDAAGEPLIIDTHQHLWDRSQLRLPWLDSAEEILRHDYRPQEYREATKGLNIRAVYMEVDVAEGQHEREAEYVAGLCRSQNEATVAAVIGGRPDSPKFTEYLDQSAVKGIVQGVRRVLHGGQTPAGYCLKPEFVAGVRALGERGLKFDLCMRPEELDDAARLTELCPDTQFVVDHCGNADPKAFMPGSDQPPSHSVDGWKRSMEGLAKRPNTICKISGVVARAPQDWTAEHLAPPINFCLDTFGPERVVFGSDWPVCLLGAPLLQWVAALREIVSSRPVADQVRLWSGNALRLYNLTIA